MATTFVTQTSAEVGSGDMWWVPWLVIRIEQDATQKEIVKALRTVDGDDFVDDQEQVDWAGLNAAITAALAVKGYTVLSLEPAEAVHLRA